MSSPLSARRDSRRGIVRCSLCDSTLSEVTTGTVIVEGYERGADGVWRILPGTASARAHHFPHPDKGRFTTAEPGDVIECAGPDGLGCATQVFDADVFGPMAG